MSEFFHIVPWFNSKEWHHVHELIISSCIVEKKQALKFLKIWKARCPALPSGVESTLILLEVHLKDIQDVVNCDNIVDDQLYRLAYSSAIMRFVNHMLDSETAKGSSLYRAANNLGVPDWIVDLRHDTAHSNNLPSLELLREACTLSLEWLERNYWDKYKNVISDYTSGQKEIASESDDSNKVGKLMNFCISIGIVIHSGSKIKNLADIPDADLQASVVDDVRDLFGNQIDLANLKTVSVKGLENLIMTQCRKMVMIRDVHIHINKALLGEDSMFLSLELLKLFESRNIETLKVLPKQYLKCFEGLLLFLHANDLLQEFVFGLIMFTQQSEDTELKILASLWIAEVLKSLNKIKRFKDIIKLSNPNDLKSKSRKELLSLYHHWFPNESNYFMLDLLKPVPSELTDITVIQPLISTYNPYLSYFIAVLLDLLEPCLPQATCRKICLLTRLISNPNKFPVTTTKIYTIEDLKESPDIEIVLDEMNDDMDVGDQQFNVNLQSVWQTASSDHAWSTCPIGQLPWQIQ